MPKILSSGPTEAEKYPYAVQLQCPTCQAIFQLEVSDEWTGIRTDSGELLRGDQLAPDPDVLAQQRSRQAELFGEADS